MNFTLSWKQQAYLVLILLMFSTSFCVSSRTEPSFRSTLSSRDQVIQTSRSLLGTRYRYAGRTPNGFDCSGFTHYVFGKINIELPAVSSEQAKLGRKIDPVKAQPGDLIFFANRKKIDHVALITQNDLSGLYIIHSTSNGVIEEDISESTYWKKRLKFACDVIR